MTTPRIDWINGKHALAMALLDDKRIPTGIKDIIVEVSHRLGSEILTKEHIGYDSEGIWICE